jgi:O-antigen/teichoic acid export membrane protein
VFALYLSGPAFFFAQLQMFLQGIPHALGRFDISGQLDALFGSLVPFATIVVVLSGGSLAAIVAARLVLSLCHCASLVFSCRRLVPGLRLRRPDGDTTRKVASFSAFTYMQRLASVTYLNADKLLIGAQQSMVALTTYVVPYTLVSRVYAMLQRLMQAIFPLSSALAARGDSQTLKFTFVYVSRYMTFLNIALCLMLALFARELLTYWLQKEPDPRAVLILIVVAYALMLESLTNVPSLVNDGLGRPHITGTAAICRVGAGVAAAWWALQWGGIVEVALSQLAVSAVFVLGFIIVVHRISLPWSLRDVASTVYGPGFVLLMLGSFAVGWRAIGGQLLSPWWFAIGVAGVVAGCIWFGWAFVLLAEHRGRLRSLLMTRLTAATGH